MADPLEIYNNTLVPMVVETTNRGERAYDIYSRLLKERQRGPHRSLHLGQGSVRIAHSAQNYRWGFSSVSGSLQPLLQHVPFIFRYFEDSLTAIAGEFDALCAVPTLFALQLFVPAHSLIQLPSEFAFLCGAIVLRCLG